MSSELKQAIKLFERSWIIDQMNIRMQNEIGGVDIQQAFKNEIMHAQEGKS